MTKEPVFGADPENLERLLSMGMEAGESGQQDDGVCSEDGHSTDNIPEELKHALATGPQLERPGSQIGPYGLCEVLGEGGMGMVYLAEQKEPIRRRVAMKVIKPGMDSKQVIARFEAERQALALLDHPNIAHVHDAGTTKHGRPYFVMEYIEGVPITQYCDRVKLTVEERLGLFMLVCDAVQHAHQKGIIHRDIKPSNIIVSAKEKQVMPKIIDFGIAKAISQTLTERTLYTEQGQLIGTPEYMSPEQAEMTSQGIDTRSDIYSLGVILYELLTGVLPFDTKTLRQGGPESIRKVICEQDPKTPSTRLATFSSEQSTELVKRRRTDIQSLGRRLRGDLDWIVMKSLEKDRNRRYGSAGELSADIQRHLNNEPVLAAPPGLVYRTRKFVRRNRSRLIAVAAAAIVLGCTTALTVISSRASREAQAAAALREHQTMQTAHEAFSDRRFAEAIDLIRPLLESKHFGPQARLLQANILVEGGYPEEAKEMLLSLVQDEPEIAGAAHALLARIYWENSDGQTDSLEQAAYYRKEAERLLPETADAVYLGALTALTVKETMQMLEKALLLDPRHYPSRRLHACTLWASQRYPEMEADALALIVSRPKDAFGYFLGATARFEQKKYEPALQDIQKALQLASEAKARRSDLLDLQCRILLALGRCEQVASDADSCLQEFPDKVIFCFHKFCALLGLGRYDQARATFDSVAEVDNQAAQDLIDRAKKYVFDTLAEGRNWHQPGQQPEGAPFVHMQEVEANYREYAAKGRRLVGKGFTADWSPDGTRLAYGSGAIGASGVAVYDFRTGQSELIIVPGKDPRWSPDGQHIVFVRDRPILDMAALASIGHRRLGLSRMSEEIWVMRSDGTEARPLAKGGWPSWSPDGNSVFFHSRVDNKLCAIDVHNRPARPRVIWDTSNPWPSVSPDGRNVTMILSDTRLCISTLEGSTPHPVQICDFPDTRFYATTWSPSGRWLSLGGYDAAIQAGLWIYDVEQGQAKKVLSGPAGLARWSANEKSVVYYVDAPILEIWTANIESLGHGKTLAEHDREIAAYYTRMIQAYPQNAQYYLSRANCYSRLNELEKAILDIEEANRLNGRTESTARWLAELKSAHETGRSFSDRALAGSMSYDAMTGTYTLVGSGYDIWGNSDELHFAWVKLDGDGSITARIDHLEHVHDWTKAGVMIRNSLDPASQHGMVLISPTGRIAFQYRDREAGGMRGVESDPDNANLPHWVRLSRKGSQFTPQHSHDGVNWESLAAPQDPNESISIEIPMNQTVHIGLAVTSHNATRAAEARFTNVTLTGSIAPTGPITSSQDIRFRMNTLQGE